VSLAIASKRIQSRVPTKKKATARQDHSRNSSDETVEKDEGPGGKKKGSIFSATFTFDHQYWEKNKSNQENEGNCGKEKKEKLNSSTKGGRRSVGAG